MTRRIGEGQSRGERCAICESRRQQATVEIFQFSDEVDTYIFKTDMAKKIVADGRAAQPVSQEMLRAFAGMNEFDLNHILHVDLSRPGIFTRRFGAPILLDGTHRAIRCFAKQKQFYAFELSYEESVECLLQQAQPDQLFLAELGGPQIITQTLFRQVVNQIAGSVLI